MPLIDVDSLYKIFGARPERVPPLLEDGCSKDEILDRTGCTVAVQDASFSVEKGELFVIMGLSGSGKSTLLRCLNRLIEPTRGRVSIDGEDVTAADPERLRALRRTHMSMVFQHFGLFPHRSVLGNVEYGLELSHMDKTARRRKARETLELVGLEEYEGSMPDELSGGMQQRVGLARALANDPEILLMDEAFSALDPLIRAEMQDELLNLQDRLHRTVIFITHHLDEALKLGDRIAIMKAGHLVQVDAPEAILADPADSYVRSFVESVDRTRFLKAEALMHSPLILSFADTSVQEAARRIEAAGVEAACLVDRSGRFQGVLHRSDIPASRQQLNARTLSSLADRDVATAPPSAPLTSLLKTAFCAGSPIVILDQADVVAGLIDRETLAREFAQSDTTTRQRPST